MADAPHGADGPNKKTGLSRPVFLFFHFASLMTSNLNNNRINRSKDKMIMGINFNGLNKDYTLDCSLQN